MSSHHIKMSAFTIAGSECIKFYFLLFTVMYCGKQWLP